MLAEKVVPLIESSDRLKNLLKRQLVNRLIDVGEFELGLKSEKPKLISRIITTAFLSLCKALGETKKQFVRCNGEVF